jgi:hypothetical protein
VLASSIEIDVSVSRTAALLGMKQLQDHRIVTLTADVRLSSTGRGDAAGDRRRYGIIAAAQ